MLRLVSDKTLCLISLSFSLRMILPGLRLCRLAATSLPFSSNLLSESLLITALISGSISTCLTSWEPREPRESKVWPTGTITGELIDLTNLAWFIILSSSGCWSFDEWWAGVWCPLFWTHSVTVCGDIIVYLVELTTVVGWSSTTEAW